MAMMGNLLTIFPGGGHYFFDPPPPAQIVVRRGQSAVIYNVRAYRTQPACMSSPPVPVAAYPAPQLGRVSTSPRSMTGPGPCGPGTYAIQRVTYTAGAMSGSESFQLYFYMRDGARDQRTVNVIVR